MVGYSRLMAVDESGTVRHIAAEQVDAFVREHRGRLVNFYGTRAAMLFEVATDPRYESLHSDPRFEVLLTGMGLGAPLPPPKG